jgi:hypothetical protein
MHGALSVVLRIIAIAFEIFTRCIVVRAPSHQFTSAGRRNRGARRKCKQSRANTEQLLNCIVDAWRLDACRRRCAAKFITGMRSDALRRVMR